MGAALICTGRRTDDVTNLMDALRYNANAPQNYNEVTGLVAQKKKKERRVSVQNVHRVHT